MQRKTIEVTVRGISPLLMHRYPLIPVEGMIKLPATEQAEHGAYRHPDTGELYVPAANVQRGLVSAAAFSKGKGRASLQKPVAACVYVAPEYLLLGTHEYAIDTRSVVNPATKGRILCHRPRLDNWELACEVEYDPTLLSEVEMRRIWDDLGQRVGILDFRPERKGPFGRFMVTLWNGKVVAEAA